VGEPAHGLVVHTLAEAAGHAFYVQVFQVDHLTLADYPGGFLLDEVAPLVGDANMDLGHGQLGLAPVVRSLLGTGQLALSAAELLLLPFSLPRYAGKSATPPG
jgi:hypothetical protein